MAVNPTSLEHLLPALLQSADDVAIVVDRDQRVLYSSAPADTPAIGQRIVEWLHADAHEGLRKHIETIFQGGPVSVLEAQLDSGERQCQIRLAPLGAAENILAVALWCRDISDLRAERARRDDDLQRLRESEQRFRTLIEQAPEAIVILDPETGHFIDANDNALRLFGMNRQQLFQHSPVTLSPARQPDGVLSSERARAVIDEALAGGFPVFEWTHLNASGEAIPCELRLALLDGQRRLVRGSITDISTRKAAEAASEALQNQLHQAHKMEALGQLTGGVAHDFNNLLTVIQGNLELLEISPLESDRVLAVARQATERAAALTQRLLAFSRKQPLSPKVIDLVTLVDDMSPLLARGLGPLAEIQIEHAEGLWSCQADPSQVENVLLNLTLNARDAMPNGGTLVIETGNRSVEVGAEPEARSGEYVYLEVRDTGAGMSPEVLARATEPFFTTKEIGSGSGLGLSMIYGFAEQSGGFMSVRSIEGEGSRVRVYLPRTQNRPHRAVPIDTKGSHGESVLVVEDEPAVMHITQLVLEQLGYHVCTANTAGKALEILQSSAPIDLMLTDIILADDISGFELAKRARRLRPKLAVLCTSGYPHGDLPAGLSLLDKPFTRASLDAAVRAVLGKPQRSAVTSR